MTGCGVSLDEIDDGFCLSEIQAPIEEGTLGEFPGLGDSGSTCQYYVEDTLRRHYSPMAANLGHVLSRIGVRPPHDA